MLLTLVLAIISDHCLIFSTRKVIKNVFNKHNTVKIRSMGDNSKEAFQTNLLNADWSSVMTSDNVIDAWSKFKRLFLSIVNNMSPLKEVRMKQRTKLWVTNDILKSIKERDESFRDFKKHKTKETFYIFKELRNKTQNLILNAKRSYFNDKLESEKKTPNHYISLSRTWVCRLRWAKPLQVRLA